MSHEFSIVTVIAATLLLLAAVCGVLFWGVGQSKEVADIGYATISDAVHRSDVVTSVEQHGEMPAAACYAILKANTERIVRLDCDICGSVTAGDAVGDCLRAHLSDRVILTLAEEESGGTYVAAVGRETP